MQKFVYTPQPKKQYQGLEKVISGGQTGADRGGLEAAQALGIKTGGTAPKGWNTEKGSDPTLQQFGLIESDLTSYAARTRKNVDDADATIAFRLQPGNGTDKTIGYAQTKTWVARNTSSDTGYKPVLVLDSLDKSNVQLITQFLERNKVKVVNIAGHRETTAPIPNFTNGVKEILQIAFEAYLLAYNKE